MIAWKRLDGVNLVFLVFVHLVGVCGTVAYLALHGLTAAAAALFTFWVLATGFSITAGYHRLFSHGSYRASALVRGFFLFFGAASIQNSVLHWASNHRRHHRFTDTDEDPYSVRKGFWWAHLGWVITKDPRLATPTAVDDLRADPLVRLQHRYYVPLGIPAGFILPAAVGFLLGDLWGGLILAGFLRLIVIYHATFSVNSFAHTLGSQPYSDRDTSRDSWITALITLGEGYHNFHHSFPFDYRNGVERHQFDPTKWLIRGLGWMNLTREMVRTPPEVILRARIRMLERDAQVGERIRPVRDRLELLLEKWGMLRQRVADVSAQRRPLSRQALRDLRRKVRDSRRLAWAAYRRWVRCIQGRDARGIAV